MDSQQQEKIQDMVAQISGQVSLAVIGLDHTLDKGRHDGEEASWGVLPLLKTVRNSLSDFMEAVDDMAYDTQEKAPETPTSETPEA